MVGFVLQRPSTDIGCAGAVAAEEDVFGVAELDIVARAVISDVGDDHVRPSSSCGVR